MKAVTRSSFIFTLFWTILFAIVFFPCLRQPFVTTFGDGEAIVENAQLRFLSWDTALRIFTDTQAVPYRPLTTLFYAVEFRFFRLFAEAYHASHLLLHWCNTLLIFLLFRRLGHSTKTASLTTLALDIHPLRAESAIWLSRLDNLLSSFFVLLTILAFLKWRDISRKRYAAAVIFCYLASCLADPASAFALPVVLILLKRLQPTGYTSTSLPMRLLGGLCILGSAFLVRSHSADILSAHLEDLWLSLYAIARHAVLLFVPTGLATFQPRPTLDVSVWLYAIGCLLGLGILARRWRRDDEFVVGWGLFLALLAPKVILLMLSNAESPFSDYDSYIAAAGPFFWVGSTLQARLAKQTGLNRKIFAVSYAVWILWIAFIAAGRTQAWQSDIDVWGDVLKKHPTAKTALIGRGRACLLAKRYDDAAADFAKAVSVDPSDRRAKQLLGEALFRSGEAAHADEVFHDLVQSDPRDAASLSWLGDIAFAGGRPQDAAAWYQKALSADGSDWRAHAGMGAILLRERRFAEALASLEKASAANPSSALAHIRRMVLYTLSGNKVEAANAFHQAISWEADGETIERLMLAEFKAAGA